MSTTPTSPNPKSPAPSVTNPNMNNPVTLQVGDRRFTTRSNTLEDESVFFANLLSGRWNDNKQADGTYFIDVDPTIFAHILRYLQSNILPLFYDPIKGYDHALYTSLLQQARYFQIERLETWIANKEYLKAVKTKYDVRVEDCGDLGIGETVGGEEMVEYHPDWKTEKVYVCPRDIAVHRGNPRACGRLCRSAQGDAEAEFVDEEVLKVVVVRKRVVFDQNVCAEE